MDALEWGIWDRVKRYNIEEDAAHVYLNKKLRHQSTNTRVVAIRIADADSFANIRW